MKLHAVNGPILVLQSHDCVAGPGSDFQAVWKSAGIDHQRMIPRSLKLIRHVGKYSSATVHDRRKLSMHEPVSPYDLSAKRLADGLMAKAYAEDRRRLGCCLDQVEANTRFIGCAGPRGKDNGPGLR